MIQHEHGVAVSIQELTSIVVHLLERSHPRMLSGVQGPVDLFVRYLRCKPGRGLTIRYQAAARKASRRKRFNIPQRWVTVMTGDAALAGIQFPSTAGQLVQPTLHVRAAGTFIEPRLAVCVFPADDGLPALDEVCAPSPRGPVFSALETAAQILLSDPSWHLTFATAEPVRYKPWSRCVIRYRLLLERASLERTVQQVVTLFGKLYSDPQHARALHATAHQLYAEQAETGQPAIPRPLGAVDTLGFVLSAAVPSSKGMQLTSPLPGLRLLQPHVLRGDCGEVVDMVIPGEELRMTATALARFHTSTFRPAGAPRTGAKEAARVGERAALIAAHNPEQAATAQRLGRQLATLLETLQPGAYRPAHGGFKPSQLLFSRHRVFVVDLDSCCLADPALDVGYFLAYLRPSGLWYDRAGMREWFEESSARFVDAYRRALCERGIEHTTTQGILQRTPLYEAAILFKIAARRVNRMNSPRPKELSSILAEVASLMDGPIANHP